MMERDTFKYKLVYHGKAVYHGLTYDLARRGVEHRQDYPEATIRQVGRKVPREEGVKWIEAHGWTKSEDK